MSRQALLVVDPDPCSGGVRATPAPGTRLAAIVESLARLGAITGAELIAMDRPSAEHVALALRTHGVVVKLQTVIVVEEVADAR